jgi:hypothetical protein
MNRKENKELQSHVARPIRFMAEIGPNVLTGVPRQ